MTSRTKVIDDMKGWTETIADTVDLIKWPEGIDDHVAVVIRRAQQLHEALSVLQAAFLIHKDDT